MKHALPIMALAGALMAATSAGVDAACSAPDVAHARVASVTHAGGMNLYRIEMTIANRQAASQPPNTLQFVDIFHDGTKMDAIGVPPLRAGHTYRAAYTFRRSADAGDGTSTLHLFVEMRQPACTASTPYTITF